MRRRAALFLLPLAVLFWFMRPRVPVERTLSIHFGPHAADVREADLHFERGDETVRDVTLFFPKGAASDVSRSVRLAPGEYEVGVRLVLDGGGERHVTRPLHAGRDGDLDLDLPVR